MLQPGGNAARHRGRAKRSALVVQALEDEIRLRGWPVGDSLGTEPELIKRFAVARTTLREAVRQLEQYGLAEMRAGKNGGLIVARPARAVVLRALASYLRLCGVESEAVLEARRTVDASAAELAARRLTAEGRARLLRMREDLARTPASVEEHVKCQLQARSLIAELSGNPLLSLCSDLLSCFTFETFAQSGPQQQASLELIAFANRSKRRIIEAVLAGRSLHARRLLLDEMAWTIDWVRAHRIEVVWPSVDRSELLGGSSRPKSGQATALRIAEDVRARGHRPGARLGSEQELRLRYDVAWPALREAVRILESHGVVRSVRGRGGGIVAGRPSAHALVASVAGYLTALNLEARDVVELHEVLTPAVAWAAIQGARPADLAVLDHPPAEPGAGALATSLALHGRIAALAGNVVMALFVDVLRAFVGRLPELGVLGAGPSQALAGVDRKLVAAVLAGDREAAEAQLSAWRRVLDAALDRA